MGTHPCVEHVAPPKTLDSLPRSRGPGAGRVDQETILLLTGLAITPSMHFRKKSRKSARLRVKRKCRECEKFACPPTF
eukprot:6952175-Prymnesium_polylepis.1